MKKLEELKKSVTKKSVRLKLELMIADIEGKVSQLSLTIKEELEEIAPKLDFENLEDFWDLAIFMPLFSFEKATKVISNITAQFTHLDFTDIQVTISLMNVLILYLNRCYEEDCPEEAAVALKLTERLPHDFTIFYLRDSLYSLDKNDSEHIKRIQAKLQRLDDRFKKERMLDVDKNVFISKFGGIIIQAFEQKYKNYLESLEMEFIDGVYDYICSSEMLSTYFTAVIFAGYGKDELFPSLREIHFDGRYCEKIKYRYGWSQVTDPTDDDSSGGAIIPFTQQDVSYSVLKGIDPTLNDLRLKQKYEIRDRLIKKASVYFDDSCKAEEFSNEISREFSSANKEFNEVIENSYMNPIVGMLQALSNEEMAKTLVS